MYCKEYILSDKYFHFTHYSEYHIVNTNKLSYSTVVMVINI